MLASSPPPRPRKYRCLSDRAALKQFYLALLFNDADPSASLPAYWIILETHSLILVDDRANYSAVLEALTSGR